MTAHSDTTILFHSMYLYIINILLLLKCNTTISPLAHYLSMWSLVSMNYRISYINDYLIVKLQYYHKFAIVVSQSEPSLEN